MNTVRFTEEEKDAMLAMYDYLNVDDFVQIFKCTRMEALDKADPWDSLMQRLKDADRKIVVYGKEAVVLAAFEDYVNEEDFLRMANGDEELAERYHGSWETFMLKAI